MQLDSFSANLAALFIGTVSTTYALTDGTDGYAVRVWDQFGDKLKKIDDLDENWSAWVDRWVILVLSQHTYNNVNQYKKVLKSDYWRQQVIKETENEKFLNDKSGKTTTDHSKNADDERIAAAKKPENKDYVKSQIERLREECKFAYSRYINKDSSWDKSWLKALSLRDRNKQEWSKDKNSNYDYWNDVYIACSNTGSNELLPAGWLSESMKHIHTKNIK
ncbi:hypothetical protein [Candidatus Mycoplasma haematohominis]|uniref:hypothetical protein n=1 Tax=Candidatus Mycoplasma haematohominis TaxID=1494318 RepID=UPI001C0A6906|nr:hypothetical protein [Candidatus Mycoplasma haemohominis]